MAQNAANVQIGRALVYVAPWVTGGGAGSFVEVGHTKAPSEVQPGIEVYDSKSEQAMGPLLVVPTDMNITIKFAAMEARADLFALLFGQPTSNISGTGSNLTVNIGDPQALEYQVKFVTRGPGTNRVRTITFWRCMLSAPDAIQYAKAGEQVYGITMRSLRDDSGGTITTNTYGMQVDT